ncbi:uncharacterized protein LOC122260168 [Penaeus japonicus]|uniref:uncharacterized protein LOC122260168 n=1 Tax=Penaeus japonicus TaxID=27405 RepID=UPI001C713C8A|nr:uncharacterized protein LOC122260168 [Penaeus japonicus]
MAATTLTMSHRDPMRTILLLATVTLQLTECSGSASVDGLLSSLQERMQGGTSAPQWSATLKNFKSFSCTARRDGLYPDLATDCSLYYRCIGGVVFSYLCSAGEALGYGTEACRPAAEVTCPRLPPSTPPCLNQTNGYYPDYTQACRGYYRCDNGSVNGRWFCENSGVWDVATGSCGSGSGLTCTPPSCWGLPDGPHPTPASSCTAYFTCQGGVRTDHVCPYGSIFDYSLKRCVPSSSSVCYEQACEGRVNGFHAAPHASCRAFFKCFNGALVELKECPRNQIFDGQRCVSATNFSCWGEGRGSCEGRDDGFFAASDCRGFFLCRHQQFIRAFRCSRGMVFNGRECVEDKNALCTSRSLRPDCSNKIDGYYTVEKSACRTFFLCQRGSKESEHTCPGANVFNGEQCVDPVLYPCPASRPQLARAARSVPDDPDCGSRPNGYYLDVPSRCTRFFYCHEGAKEFVRSCPPGERFNGLTCISQDVYECPVISGAPECLLRGDGVYQDWQSGCSSYYQCISGVKIVFKCPKGQLHDGKVCKPAALVHCPPATLCSHQRLNATLVDTDRQCQAYFRCQEEVLLWYRVCEKGQVYNGRECVPHFFYTCPARVSTSCLAKPDGFYQDLSARCRSYYECRGGEQVSEHTCDDAMLFNGEDCVSASSYVCPVDGAKECRIGQNGFVQDVESGCRRYYYCYNGKSFPRECPEERVFNGHTCVPPTHYKCPSLPAVDRSRCSGPDGYYPDLHMSCRSFYYCLGGRRISYACPEGEAFNGAQCVPETAVTCPSPSSCHGKINGFYQDVLAGCRKYFYCHGGVKYEHTCPGEQVHNGRTCVPASTYTCPSPTDDRQCVGKFSGLYPDLASLCQVYYRCQGGVKTQTHACPHSQVFNGYECVPFFEFSCSSFGLVPSSSPSRLDLPPEQLLAEPGAPLPSAPQGILATPAHAPPSGQDLGAREDSLSYPDQKIEGSGDIATGIPERLAAASGTASGPPCEGLPDGSYTNVSAGCEEFVTCRQQSGLRSRCPEGRLFSPITGRCEAKDLLACPQHTHACEFLPDGVHGEEESDCLVFFTCRAGRLHLVSSCPEGTAFDERSGECRRERQGGCQNPRAMKSSLKETFRAVS